MRLTWTPEMGTVSGKGGDEELACQAMVRAGVAWLEEHPHTPTLFHELKGKASGGIVVARNRGAVKLLEAMVAVYPKRDHVDAPLVPAQSLRLALEHAVAIDQQGWGNYKQQALKAGPGGA